MWCQQLLLTFALLSSPAFSLATELETDSPQDFAVTPLDSSCHRGALNHIKAVWRHFYEQRPKLAMAGAAAASVQAQGSHTADSAALLERETAFCVAGNASCPFQTNNEPSGWVKVACQGVVGWVGMLPARLGVWQQAEGVDFLRRPWHSAGAVAAGLAAKGKEAASELWLTFKPGGRLSPDTFFESQGHLVVEALLLLLLLVMLVQRSYKPGSPPSENLTGKEVDDLCKEWEPEPLAPPLPEERSSVTTPVITGDIGRYLMADGVQLLNFVSTNFLGIAGDLTIQDTCKRTIVKYGVGACGPRAFYGTIDVHLDLEAALASYMGTEEAILYAYDMATVPSVLPAFANKRDLIVCDEAVGFHIQNGAILSRARILYFKHNDMADLEAVLKKVAAEHARGSKPLNRRYLVVEGIYANTGDVAPLAQIAALKHKYKYRLLVDESISLGVLGTNGRGAAEAAGLTLSDVDIITSSLGNSIASVGGFCTGSREIVDHQRLSGLGYIFSAALPPYLATAATGALALLHKKGTRLALRVTAAARRMRQLLSDIPGLVLVGGEADVESPQLHLRLAEQPESHARGEELLSGIVEHCRTHSAVMVTVQRLAHNDRCAAGGPAALPSSLRLAVTALHEEDDLEQCASALRTAASAILSRN